MSGIQLQHQVSWTRESSRHLENQRTKLGSCECLKNFHFHFHWKFFVIWLMWVPDKDHFHFHWKFFIVIWLMWVRCLWQGLSSVMRMVIITMIMVKTLSAVDHHHPTLPFIFMLTFTFSPLWIQPPGRWSCLSILPRDTSQLLQSLRRPSMNIVMHCLQCQVWTLFQREPLPWKTLIYLFFSVSLFYDRIEMMSNGQVSFHLLSNISNIQCDVTHIPLSLAPCHLYLKPPDSCNYF